MYELISNPGVQFYVLRLSGTLSYTFSIGNKAPRNFELSNADFDPTVPQAKEMEAVSHPGIEASAVGLQLRIVKNDGILDLHYEGRHGSTASRKFQGLKEIGKGAGMDASAGTQTCIATLVVKDM
ncbi:hypothetical protein CC86DRAFT_429426 [Ophiobolus disseminans]|uniref:Uncharacterized protein n=1 Tax=Ophiobolus disseminans TaxID=1469910 RepID=A0A6A6ZGZ6_9PLEO|nr:hypothetical protein CC86DRAFT_429426 [Ophiobolus disseminans]